MKKATWLVFDLDDTLIPSSEIYERTYLQMKLGSDFKRARTQVKSQIAKGHTSRHHRLLYFKKWLETKKSFSASKALRLQNRYEELLVKNLRRHLKKSRIPQDLLLLKRTFKIALFTNETLRTQLLKIQCIDPHGKIFDQIVTSEELGMEKKTKGAYTKLLKILKAPAKSCIMIGDDREQDILPARKQGFKKAYQVKLTTDPGASYTLKHQLPELFV